MTDNLKPCPFCGGKNVLSTELQDGLPFIAYCQCGAENEAENWNNRPIEDALQARIAELEKIIDKFASVGTDVYHRVRAEFYEDASVRADWRELMHTYRKEWVI